MVVFIFLLFFIILPLQAADYGIHGHTYDIIEPDLLKQIERKLTNLEESGELAVHNKELRDRAQKSIARPLPVKFITKATEARVFLYDPSITVPYDLKDHKGVVFQKQGTRVNPLTLRSLSSTLLFIDGDDRAQVDWALAQSETSTTKIILTNGSPFDLMNEMDRPVFFDQEGRLTSKLGIQHVPALVKQDGFSLKINEVRL